MCPPAQAWKLSRAGRCPPNECRQRKRRKAEPRSKSDLSWTRTESTIPQDTPRKFSAATVLVDPNARDDLAFSAGICRLRTQACDGLPLQTRQDGCRSVQSSFCSCCSAKVEATRRTSGPWLVAFSACECSSSTHSVVIPACLQDVQVVTLQPSQNELLDSLARSRSDHGMGQGKDFAL